MFAFEYLNVHLIAIQHLRSILSLIFTNSDVRKLPYRARPPRPWCIQSNEYSTPGPRRPSARRRDRPSRPIRHRRRTHSGYTVGPNETPVLEAKVQGTRAVVAQHPREELGTGCHRENVDDKVKTGEQVYLEGRSQAEGVSEQGWVLRRKK
jgi:hypothetical protein